MVQFTGRNLSIACYISFSAIFRGGARDDNDPDLDGFLKVD
jgi:hypothetical protein